MINCFVSGILRAFFWAYILRLCSELTHKEFVDLLFLLFCSFNRYVSWDSECFDGAQEKQRHSEIISFFRIANVKSQLWTYFEGLHSVLESVPSTRCSLRITTIARSLPLTPLTEWNYSRTALAERAASTIRFQLLRREWVSFFADWLGNILETNE